MSRKAFDSADRYRSDFPSAGFSRSHGRSQAGSTPSRSSALFASNDSGDNERERNTSAESDPGAIPRSSRKKRGFEEEGAYGDSVEQLNQGHGKRPKIVDAAKRFLSTGSSSFDARDVEHSHIAAMEKSPWRPPRNSTSRPRTSTAYAAPRSRSEDILSSPSVGQPRDETALAAASASFVPARQPTQTRTKRQESKDTITRFIRGKRTSGRIPLPYDAFGRWSVLSDGFDNSPSRSNKHAMSDQVVQQIREGLSATVNTSTAGLLGPSESTPLFVKAQLPNADISGMLAQNRFYSMPNNSDVRNTLNNMHPTTSPEIPVTSLTTPLSSSTASPATTSVAGSHKRERPTKTSPDAVAQPPPPPPSVQSTGQAQPVKDMHVRTTFSQLIEEDLKCQQGHAGPPLRPASVVASGLDLNALPYVPRPTTSERGLITVLDAENCVQEKIFLDADAAAVQEKIMKVKNQVRFSTDDDADADKDDLRGVDKMDWTCQSCGHRNSKTASCNNCEEPRETRNSVPWSWGDAPGMSAFLSEMKAQWKCSNCNAFNPMTAAACLSCEWPRPISGTTADGSSHKVAATTTASAATMMPSASMAKIGTGGFSFAPALTNQAGAVLASSKGFSFGVTANRQDGVEVVQNAPPTSGGFVFAASATDSKTSVAPPNSSLGFKFGSTVTSTEPAETKPIDGVGGFVFGSSLNDSSRAIPASSTAPSAFAFPFGSDASTQPATSRSPTDITFGAATFQGSAVPPVPFGSKPASTDSKDTMTGETKYENTMTALPNTSTSFAFGNSKPVVPSSSNSKPASGRDVPASNTETSVEANTKSDSAFVANAPDPPTSAAFGASAQAFKSDVSLDSNAPASKSKFAFDPTAPAHKIAFGAPTAISAAKEDVGSIQNHKPPFTFGSNAGALIGAGGQFGLTSHVADLSNGALSMERAGSNSAPKHHFGSQDGTYQTRLGGEDRDEGDQRRKKSRGRQEDEPLPVTSGAASSKSTDLSVDMAVNKTLGIASHAPGFAFGAGSSTSNEQHGNGSKSTGFTFGSTQTSIPVPPAPAFPFPSSVPGNSNVGAPPPLQSDQIAQHQPPAPAPFSFTSGANQGFSLSSQPPTAPAPGAMAFTSGATAAPSILGAPSFGSAPAPGPFGIASGASSAPFAFGISAPPPTIPPVAFGQPPAMPANPFGASNPPNSGPGSFGFGGASSQLPVPSFGQPTEPSSFGGFGSASAQPSFGAGGGFGSQSMALQQHQSLHPQQEGGFGAGGFSSQQQTAASTAGGFQLGMAPTANKRRIVRAKRPGR